MEQVATKPEPGLSDAVPVWYVMGESRSQALLRDDREGKKKNELRETNKGWHQRNSEGTGSGGKYTV